MARLKTIKEWSVLKNHDMELSFTIGGLVVESRSLLEMRKENIDHDNLVFKKMNEENQINMCLAMMIGKFCDALGMDQNATNESDIETQDRFVELFNYTIKGVDIKSQNEKENQ